MKYSLIAFLVLFTVSGCKEFDCKDTLINATANNIIEVTDHTSSITFRNASNTRYFTLEETLNIIEKSNKYLWPYEKHNLYERYNSRETPFPIEILRKWVSESFNSINHDRDKWTAKLAIVLYDRGDREVVNVKNLVNYFKRHARYSP